MRRVLKAFLVFTILYLSAAGVFAQEFDGQRIRRISFEGTVKSDSEKLKSALFLIEGMQFKSADADRDIKNLYNYGYFDDIKLFITSEKNELTLRYVVKERPWIKKIYVRGSEAVNEEEIIKSISNTEESFYNPFTLTKDQDKILELYQKEGFVGTKITFTTEKTSEESRLNLFLPNQKQELIFNEDYDEEIQADYWESAIGYQLNLIISVHEGEEIFVNKVTFSGTRRLNPDNLQDAMEFIKEPSFFGMKKFPFSKMDFETDKEKITQLAKNQGFMDFKILDAKAEIKPLSDKTKGYFVTITVEEGEQYTYAGMDIRGNKKIAKPELMEYLTMDPGDIYNDTLFTNFVRNSYIEYQSNGFFYAKLTPIDTVDKEKRSIFYTLDIFEGDKVHVENMYIIGNTKTATHVADREIRIKEGEIYDLSKLLRSRERLMKSQIFSNAIFEPRTGSEEGLIDIFWKLEEAKTGMLTIGGGYGTLSGFTLFGQISELNLFGLGYNTSLRFDYGQTRKSISTTFGSGWIGYLPISYKFSVSYSWEQIALIPKYDRFSDSSGTPGHDGIWDKIDDTGTPIQEGDPGFDSIIDQDRDGDGNTIDDPADAYDADRFVRKKTIGFGVGAGYSFSEYWSTGANQSVTLSKYYDPKNIDVNNLYEDDEYRLKSLLQDGDYALTTRTGFGITYDSSDNYLTPTKGLVFAPGVTFYGLAGGYSQFTQLTMDISGYVSLIKLKRANWNLVWANHLGLTTIGALPGKSDPQLFSEYRLSFDGMRELRGWEELVYEENLKGLGKVSFGSELRIPIPGTQNLLWWAFFFDAGNVSQDPYTLPSKFSEYRFSEGFGLKIEIPMFPIRLYFAKRLMWDDKWFKEVSDWTFVLSIAGFF